MEQLAKEDKDIGTIVELGILISFFLMVYFVYLAANFLRKDQVSLIS